MERSGNPDRFLSQTEKDEVDAAIKEAERNTSAEVKLILVRHCWGDIKDKAMKLFTKYNLHQTEDRNCVLILLVLANHDFLIYGDAGIHEKVGQDFWIDVKDTMLASFKQDAFGTGLCDGIRKIGDKLQHYFPYKKDDKNEVDDSIAYEG